MSNGPPQPRTRAPGAGPGLVWRVTAHGLPGSSARLHAPQHGDLAGDQPLDDQTWLHLLADVDLQRVPGFLMAAIEQGALPVTDAQRAQARDRHLDSCRSVLGLERRLLEVVDVLESADIEVVVLKGSAHAHLLYEEPGLRHFGDVDVLVPSERIMDAVAVLERERGATRQVPEVRPGFDRRFAKGVTLEDPDGTELDIHRNLLFGTFGFQIDTGELFRSSVPFEVGGREFRALGPEARLLHACYHAGLGDKRPRGNSMRDLGQMLAFEDHDPERVVALAQRWRSLAVVSRAVAVARDYLDVEVEGPIGEAVRAHRLSRREARAIASYVGVRNTFGPKVRASLPYCNSAGEAAGFLWASAVPSPAFLRRRAAGRADWLGRGLRRLRRR